MSRKSLIAVLLMVAMVLVFAACQVTPVQEENKAYETMMNSAAQLVDAEADISDLFAQQDAAQTTGMIKPTDKVTVIVEVEGTPLVDYYFDNNISGSFTEFMLSEEAKVETFALMETQQMVKDGIAALGIDVRYSHVYTELMNGFALEMLYGDMAKIEELPFVENAFVSIEYSLASTQQAQASLEYLMQESGILENNTEYQGEGMFIAVLDNAFDVAHSAFANAPSTIGVTKADIESLIPAMWLEAQWNPTAASWYQVAPDINGYYYSEKIPFKFHYNGSVGAPSYNVTPSKTYVTTYGGYHGTHVASIIAGNDDTITGSAPQAQLALMKVFGTYSTGAQYADIAAALADCAVLGVDAVNMSFGAVAGFTNERSEAMFYVQEAYDKLDKLGILVCAAAGNDGNQAYAYENKSHSTSNPDTGLVSSPASYDAVLAVASSSNAPTYYMEANGKKIFYNVAVNTESIAFDFENNLIGNNESKTLEVVVVPGTGTPEDYEGLDVTGKIVLVSRGGITFEDKHLNAKNAGAAACIIYNNVAGNINAQMTSMEIPTATINLIDAEAIIAMAKEGKVEITFSYESKANLMAASSSWGPLSDLTLKPDITAPGENIYAAVPEAKNESGYDYLSGTSMATPNLVGVMTALLQYVNEQYPGYTSKQARDLVYQIMMSTADQVMDESGYTASVRHQGAGVANLESAIATKAYLNVTGSTRTKLELGDDPNRDGVYTLRFNVINMSEEELQYEVSAEVFGETAYPNEAFAALRSNPFEEATILVKGKTVENGIVTVPAGEKVAVTVVITLSEAEKAYLDERFENGSYVEGYAYLNPVEEGEQLSIPFLGFYGNWEDAPILDSTLYDDEDADIYENQLLGYIGAYRGYAPLGSYGLFNVPDGYEMPEASVENISLTYDTTGFYYIYSAYMLNFRNISYLEYNLYNEETGLCYYTAYAYNVRKSYYSASYGSVIITGHALNIPASAFDTAGNMRLIFTIDAYGDDEETVEQLVFPVYIDCQKPELLSTTIREENGRTYLDIEAYDNHGINSFIPCTPKKAGSTSLKIIGSYAIPVAEWTNGLNNKFTIDITDWLDDIVDGKLYFQLQDWAMNTSTYLVATVTEESKTGVNTTVVDNGNSCYNEWMSQEVNEAWIASQERLGIYNEETYEAELAAAIAEELANRSYVKTYSTKGLKVYTDSTEEHKFTVNADGVLVKYEGPGGDVIIPSDIGVKTIGASKEVFQYRTDIAKVTLPTTCETIDKYGFRNSSLTEIVFPENGSFKTFGDYAFYYCKSLDNVKIPSTVTAISAYCFAYTHITSIEIGENVESVGKYAFQNAVYLKSIYYPNTVKTFGSNIHTRNYELKEARIPTNLTAMPSGMFAICTKLEKVNIHELTKCTNFRGLSLCLSLKELVIPQVYDENGNEAAISISGFDYLRDCTKIEIYPDIKSAINASFEMINSCKEINFYGDITGDIYNGSFSNCEMLEKITFHGNVTGSIRGSYTFMTNPKLKTIEFKGDLNGTYVSGNSTYAIAQQTCMDNPELEEVIFGGNIVGEFCGGAFTGSEKVISFTVAEGNTYLTKDAETGIVYNKDKTSLYVPGHWDYDGEIVIPDTIKTFALGTAGQYLYDRSLSMTLEDAGFSGMATIWINIENEVGKKFPKEGLKKITIGKGTTELADNALSNFVNCEIDWNGANVERIMNYAMMNFGPGEELVVPASATYLPYVAFGYNDRVKTIRFEGDYVQVFGNYLFRGCTNLEEAYLPKNIDGWYAGTFWDCTNLRKVDLGGAPLGHWIFKNAPNVEELILSNTPYIGKSTNFTYLDQTKVTEIHIPASTYSIDANAFTNVNIKVLTVAEDSPYFAASQDALFSADFSEIIYYAKNSTREVFEIPDATTYVADKVFADAVNLKEVVIGNGIEYFGTRAFLNTSVEKITISEGTGIFDYTYVFFGCPIKTIIIEEGNETWKMEGKFFMSANGKVLWDYIVGETTDAKISVPEGVSYIAPYAFVNEVAIEELVLPTTLNVVGAKAFFGCTGLKKIEFKSAKAPRFEVEYDKNRALMYSNFVCNIEDVAEGGLDIEVILPDHESYKTTFWKRYFGL